ncbi:hypothetical protein CTI12_AA335700 [Artemisia annua]|uniref:Uncharacterized protein n=1 Tax=Artemisia annua TaxID=35608 RepID=A0A2U1MUP9_ARTAN|nr:hypothetical protein CTI12_AA335700 [Artemisia annua]
MKKMDYRYEVLNSFLISDELCNVQKNMRYDQLRDAVAKRKPGWEYLQEVKILESFRILGFEHGATYSEIKKGIYETQFRTVKIINGKMTEGNVQLVSGNLDYQVICSRVCIYQVWVINWIYSQFNSGII